jgi:hypothetical protein
MKQVLKTLAFIFVVQISSSVYAAADDQGKKKENNKNEHNLPKCKESGDNKAPKRGKPIRGNGN